MGSRRASWGQGRGGPRKQPRAARERRAPWAPEELWTLGAELRDFSRPETRPFLWVFSPSVMQKYKSHSQLVGRMNAALWEAALRPRPPALGQAECRGSSRGTRWAPCARKGLEHARGPCSAPGPSSYEMLDEGTRGRPGKPLAQRGPAPALTELRGMGGGQRAEGGPGLSPGRLGCAPGPEVYCGAVWSGPRQPARL